MADPYVYGVYRKVGKTHFYFIAYDVRGRPIFTSEKRFAKNFNQLEAVAVAKYLNGIFPRYRFSAVILFERKGVK